MSTPIPTDIAELQQYNDDSGWETIAYIGPDRAGGRLDQFSGERIRLCDLRIRYIETDDREY